MKELCIRIMERFFATTNARPETEPLYLDLLDAYMDVLIEVARRRVNPEPRQRVDEPDV